MEFLDQPWPWYIGGPLIGLTVPVLLLMGNKKLGVSSTLRQIAAACVPLRIPLLNYDWKKESWNLFFVGGILLGGFLGGFVMANPTAVAISARTVEFLKLHGLNDLRGMMPQQLFSWSALFTLKGFLLMAPGGFMVGFGTRYAQGCTSGHGILGLSALQWPSLLATSSFFIGGILFSRFILPLLFAV